MNPISIVLLDGLRIVRKALRALVETDPGLAVIGEAGNGLEGADLTERLQPDVLVLDLSLPGLNGLDVIREVAQRAPRVGILVLAARNDEGIVLQALKSGATGYVARDCTPEILFEAIRAVAAGSRYLFPTISNEAIDDYISQTGSLPPDPYDTLSFREREVLQLAAEGHTNAEIAERLSISPRTVEAHRLRAMHKLDLRSRTELIRFAIRRGILQREE